MRSVEDLIKLHGAWWKLENERPLLNIAYRETFPWMWLQSDHMYGMEFLLKDGTIAKDGPLTPDMLSPERMHTKPATHGDMFLPVMPYGKIPWLEAICGVTPRVSVKANSIWAGFGQGVWPHDWWKRDIEAEFNQEWLDKLLEFQRYLADNFYGPYVITLITPNRGPLDIMAALTGDKNVVMGMHRHPEETRKLLDKLTNLLIKVEKAQLEIIPTFQGGYVNNWGVWAPGTIGYLQEDEAAYLSPKLYKDFVLPCDRKVIQAFDYTTTHFHSRHYIHMDAVTDINELGSLEIELEPPPYGPTLKEWIPILKRLIKKKPLILHAWYLSREQIKTLLKELPPQGLFLETYVQETGENYYVYRE